MENNIKKGLFILLFTVLFLPLLQKNIPFIGNGVELHGYFDVAPDADFTWKSWFGGDFQINKSKFYNDHVGFRPLLLKLHSQVNYSLFQKLDYGGTTLGNDNYLFYDDYIDAYYGRDFAGYRLLFEQMSKLKAIQDTLARCGKTLILVYAPCKAWFYPEHIPLWKRRPQFPDNNYKTCARIGDSLGINQIDLNKWYLSLKDTASEILYSRQGIHWTNYGSILCADSLIKYMERARHIHMPHPKWTKAIHTTEARVPDNDMVNTLNLFFPIAKETFCYPELFYPDSSSAKKPNVIFIGDSYTINFIRTGVMEHMSNEWQFWFVFKYVLNKDNYNASEFIKMEHYDWKNELKRADCVIVLNTPKNASTLGSDFIKQAYDYYFPKK